MRHYSHIPGAQSLAQPPLPDGSARIQAGLWLIGILPRFFQRWVSLGEKTVYSWLDDRAPTMGAAIAFYTVFSLAPMLVIVIAVAGFVFGQEAAEGALFGELTKLVGPDRAGAVQAMLRSARETLNKPGKRLDRSDWPGWCGWLSEGRRFSSQIG